MGGPGSAGPDSMSAWGRWGVGWGGVVVVVVVVVVVAVDAAPACVSEKTGFKVQEEESPAAAPPPRGERASFNAGQ
jgi:hypothetical protein